MQRKNIINTEVENKVMDKIMSNEVKMRPKWYFVLGSLTSYIGVIGSIIGATFFTNITIFLIRKRGPGLGRISMLLESFPLWIPLLAIALLILGIWMLKKYDFSYKKNFLTIVVAIIAAVFLSAQIIDFLGLSDIWTRKGPMKGLYGEHQINGQELFKNPRNNRSN